MGILYSPQFHLHQETKIAALGKLDISRPHGKIGPIGDSEQSKKHQEN